MFIFGVIVYFDYRALQYNMQIPLRSTNYEIWVITMLGTTAKYIYTVYRLKSFSLASQELFISQPALSRAIKKAEVVFGAPIFNRKTLPISLTPEGEVYIEAIEKMLQIERSASERVYDNRHKAYYSTLEEPFSVYGVFYENGKYRRIPEKDAKAVGKGVQELHTHSAGGRIKFVTDSPFIAIKAVITGIEKLSHFTLAAIAGFDLYVGKEEEYFDTFVPPFDMTGSYESIINLGSSELREITIHFPLYSCVESLYIGLDEDAVLKKSVGYKPIKPIVYYGSSITQGGCASRPGNAYENIISRALQVDHINLGLSGNAKGEDEIAQYISNLEMSVFVYDYDHNAPTLKHLEDTHQRMFQIIRNRNPELPIILMSRPKYRLNEEDQQRLAIIKKTYTDAVAAGDKNVYFIDGPTLMQYAGDDGAVDRDHPNDLGFHSIAKVLISQLQTFL